MHKCKGTETLKQYAGFLSGVRFLIAHAKIASLCLCTDQSVQFLPHLSNDPVIHNH